MKDNRTIKFDLDNDNRPLIESFKDVADLKKSLFKDIYSSALLQIDNYLESKGKQAVDKDLQSYTDSNNNIFAFIGERGSGKTSCMLSVAKMLKDKNDALLKEYHAIKKHGFLTIGMIDPTYFESERNVVSIFVAKLYSLFIKDSLHHDDPEHEKLRRELIGCFSKTQKHLMALLGEQDKNFDDLDRLTSYAASVDLKSDIHELVDIYLAYKKAKDSVLLLLIDDIDLNTKDAAKMAELVRKYLIQDNVVILMSLKLDQLEAIKRLEYMNEYKALIDKDKDYLTEIDEMVDRYIGKFIPQSQRIYLPDTSRYMDIDLEVKWTQNEKEHKLPFASIKQAVPQLIFWKTRYLFYNSAQKVSYIVPRNLRELRQLLKLLVFMPQYATVDEGGNILENYNKTTFKKYLFKHWPIDNLGNESRILFDQILAQDCYSLLNNTTLRVLQTKFGEQLKDDELTDKFKDILSVKNTTYNISLGDILALVEALEYRCVDSESQKFLFLVKTLYSIRLYEAYDMVTGTVGAGCQSMEGAIIKDNDIECSLMTRAQLGQYSEYEKLVSGIFINTDIQNIVKPNGDKSNSHFYLRTSDFEKFYSECLKKNDEGMYYSDSIRLLEFFMICLAHDEKSKNNSKGDNYRETLDFAADKVIKHDMLRFDLGAIFFNLHRLDKCYRRYKQNDEFADAVEAIGNDSLRAMLIKETKAEHPNEKGEFESRRWLSFCSIRNVEILLDLLEYCRQIKYSDVSNMSAVLLTFFESLSKYSIKSYDRENEEENKEPYNINFKFFKAFVDVLTPTADYPIWEDIYQRGQKTVINSDLEGGKQPKEPVK